MLAFLALDSSTLRSRRSSRRCDLRFTLFHPVELLSFSRLKGCKVESEFWVHKRDLMGPVREVRLRYKELSIKQFAQNCDWNQSDVIYSLREEVSVRVPPAR